MAAAEVVPSLGRRLGARALDAVLELVVAGLAGLAVPADRPLARAAAILAVAVAYEVLGACRGGTPGKRVAGLRVVQVGEAAVAPGPAVVRAVVVVLTEIAAVALPVVALAAVSEPLAGSLATLALLLPVVAVVAATVASPLRRGLHDLAAGTVVVDRSVQPPVHVSDLDRLTEHRAPRPSTRHGAVATAAERWRAWLSRFDDAPLLVLGILGSGVTAAAVGLWWQLAIGTVWCAAFVADETLRIARDGGPAGARRAGLAVVDVVTGEPPRPARALARSVVLGVGLLGPGVQLVGAPLLLAWMRLAPSGRGLQDLAGRTVVVRRARVGGP